MISETQRDKYREALRELRRFLRSPRTAAEVADRFGCSRPTAYARVRALEVSGVRVYQGARATTRRGVAISGGGVPSTVMTFTTIAQRPAERLRVAR